MNHPMHAPGSPSSAPVEVADRELLERHARGDRAAFEALVTRHGPLVYASSRRQVGAADADDATQAVFLILDRHAASAAQITVLPAWLLRVARNVCATQRRSHARRQKAEQEAAMHQATAAVPQPEHPALAHVDELLDKLPAHEREVIALHLLQGLPQEDAARRAGCGLNTFRSRLSRGLARMRASLQRRGVMVPVPALLALLSAQASTAMPAPLALAIGGGAATTTARALALAAPMTWTRGAWASVSAAGVVLCAGAGLWLWASSDAASAPPEPSTPATATTTEASESAAPKVAAAVAATTPPLSAYLPADADMRVVAPDLQRTWRRLRASPYASLAERPSGAWVLRKLEQRLPGIDVTATRSAVQGVSYVNGPDGRLAGLRITMALDAGAAADAVDGMLHEDGPRTRASAPGSTDWVEATDDEDTRSLRVGSLFMITNVPPAPGSSLPPATTPADDVDPDADLAWLATVPQLESSSVGMRMAMSITPLGARTTTMLDGEVELVRPTAIRPVDRTLLRSLPGDTLAAMVRSADGLAIDLTGRAMSGKATGLSGMLGSVEDLKHRLQQAGGPETLQLEGNVVAYLRAGAPLPSLTVAARMSEGQARSLLAALATVTDGSVGDDGTCVASLPVLGTIQGAYIDGDLVVTSHADGVEGHRSRTGGFLDRPAIAAAIAQVPEGAYSALLIDGPEAWSLAAAYAGVLTSQLPPEAAKAFATLPADLRTLCAATVEARWDEITPSGRRSVSVGPVLGLIGGLLDIGTAGVPMPPMGRN